MIAPRHLRPPTEPTLLAEYDAGKFFFEDVIGEDEYDAGTFFFQDVIGEDARFKNG
jgi:hypothetical protein